MNTHTIELEVVSPDMPPVIQPDAQLVKYASETGLEKATTETLVDAFHPIFRKARAAIDSARGVAESVKDATCVREIARSRACRLALRSIRIESDDTRKKHKNHALLYGRAVDGFHNILLADLSPVEDALKEAEDIAEKAEAMRMDTLRAARLAELQPLFETPILVDLAEMSDAQYAATLADAKLLQQAKLEAAAKAEADRLAKETADRLERERVAAENAELKRKAIAAEAAAKAEREAADKRLADERRKAQEEADKSAAIARAEQQKALAAAKAESDRLAAIAAKELAAKEAEALKVRKELADRKAKESAEAARVEAERKATEAAERKSAAAPDKAKLMAFATTVRRLKMPELSNEKASGELRSEIEHFAVWIEALNV